jgi:putative signal transducing protein
MSQQGDSGPVIVFRTNDPGLLAVAQSLLRAANIEFFVVGQVVSGMYPGGAAGPYGVPAICVGVEDVEAARDLLKELT